MMANGLPEIETLVTVRRNEVFVGCDYKLMVAEINHRTNKVYVPELDDRSKWTETEPFNMYNGGCLSLNKQLAQQLIDSLWDCGLRPSEGTGSAGAFAAVQSHLNDMRTIAFKKLNI